jgi:glycosyltransferase involved in cell wall biosynthesis
MGVDLKQFSMASELLVLPPEFRRSFRILSVGSTLPRKNLRILPFVLSELVKNGINPSLIRVGDPLPKNIRNQIIDVIDSTKLFELGKIPDSSLASIYQHSDAFIMPSLIEGFGLPVIEAMAAGCPVVCSNTTSLPEVAGNAALQSAPDDARAMAGHLLAIAKDEHMRLDLIEKGKRNAERFSWDSHTEQLLTHYQSVI